MIIMAVDTEASNVRCPISNWIGVVSATVSSFAKFIFDKVTDSK